MSAPVSRRWFWRSSAAASLGQPSSRHTRVSVSECWTGLCLGIPGAVLVGAFVWLAIDKGEVGLWNVVVHESGRYTLGQTVLYFSHFLREIPTVIAMALLVVAVHRPAAPATDSSARAGVSICALAAAAALAAVSFLVVTSEQGLTEAVRNFTQLYTRDDLPLYGSHWRFHLLSTIWFGLAAAVLVRLARRHSEALEQPYRTAFPVAAWTYVAALTVIFGLGLDSFVDPRYLGHQAREILTHGTTTLPLGLGIMALVDRDERLAQDSASPRRPEVAVIVGFLAIPIYLAVAVVASDALSTGQTQSGFAAMVGAHYFEHTLDLVLFALLVVGLAIARSTFPAAVARWRQNRPSLP